MKTRPTAPADRTNLKTWTAEQLTYAAPFWVARLQASIAFDDSLIRSIVPNTQPWLDALKMRINHQQQLAYWKLVLSDRIFYVLPHSLRTFHRNGSVQTHRGTPARRHSTVGNWDKADGIWPKTI